MCSQFYPVPLTDGTGLSERRELAVLDEGPSIHKELSRGKKIFDGGSMGLKGGMAVVEVVVKWNDGGISDEVVVKGGRRLSCTFCAFRIAASSLEKVVEVVDWSFEEASLPWKSSRGEAQWVSLEGLRTRVLEELMVMPQFVGLGCLAKHWRCDGIFVEGFLVEEDALDTISIREEE
ncbi:hypothetical protein Tco_1451799 [Tanacetum coccineum]